MKCGGCGAERIPDCTCKPEPMWSYWRDKKGYQEALEQQYPQALTKNTQLRAAYDQLVNAKRLIDVIMEEGGL